MLHALVIAVSKEAAEIVSRVAQKSGHVQIDSVLCPLGSIHHLTRMVNTFSPDVVLAEMGDMENAARCVEFQRARPDVPVVGFSIAPMMIDGDWPGRGGYAPVQPWPLNPDQLMRTMRDAIRGKSQGPLKNLIAILPAKAGSGASTIVLNIAGQLAGPFARHVLVIEADLRSGSLADTLGVTPETPLAKTLEHADGLSSALWSNYITEVAGIHLMATARKRIETLPQWYSYYHLVRSAADKYDPILVDLPEVINSATAELVRTARIVYLVTTPELPSLQLARSRLEELDAEMDSPERVRIILNRWHPGDIDPAQVAQVLKRQVEAVIPNDYRSVRKAILKNCFVSNGSRLGGAYRKLAGFLVGENEPPKMGFSRSLLALLRTG